MTLLYPKCVTLRHIMCNTFTVIELDFSRQIEYNSPYKTGHHTSPANHPKITIEKDISRWPPIRFQCSHILSLWRNKTPQNIGSLWQQHRWLNPISITGQRTLICTRISPNERVPFTWACFCEAHDKGRLVPWAGWYGSWHPAISRCAATQAFIAQRHTPQARGSYDCSSLWHRHDHWCGCA